MLLEGTLRIGQLGHIAAHKRLDVVRFQNLDFLEGEFFRIYPVVNRAWFVIIDVWRRYREDVLHVRNTGAFILNQGDPDRARLRLAFRECQIWISVLAHFLLLNLATLVSMAWFSCRSEN